MAADNRGVKPTYVLDQYPVVLLSVSLGCVTGKRLTLFEFAGHQFLCLVPFSSIPAVQDKKSLRVKRTVKSAQLSFEATHGWVSRLVSGVPKRANRIK